MPFSRKEKWREIQNDVYAYAMQLLVGLMHGAIISLMEVKCMQLTVNFFQVFDIGGGVTV